MRAAAVRRFPLFAASRCTPTRASMHMHEAARALAYYGRAEYASISIAIGHLSRVLERSRGFLFIRARVYRCVSSVDERVILVKSLSTSRRQWM